MAENDQHLKHGKALCGKVFGRFVETFNALVDFMLGIKGDADGKNGEGHITYDRKNNIIRCDGCGGGGGGGSPVADKSCFRIETRSCEGDEGEEVETRRYLVDCYYNVGGITWELEDVDIEDLIPHQDEETSDSDEEEDTIIYFEMDNDDNFSVGACTIEELAEKQNDASTYAFPLYIFDSKGNLKTDLRTAPQIQMVEALG